MANIGDRELAALGIVRNTPRSPQNNRTPNRTPNRHRQLTYDISEPEAEAPNNRREDRRDPPRDPQGRYAARNTPRENPNRSTTRRRQRESHRDSPRDFSTDDERPLRFQAEDYEAPNNRREDRRDPPRDPQGRYAARNTPRENPNRSTTRRRQRESPRDSPRDFPTDGEGASQRALREPSNQAAPNARPPRPAVEDIEDEHFAARTPNDQRQPPRQNPEQQARAPNEAPRPNPEQQEARAPNEAPRPNPDQNGDPGEPPANQADLRQRRLNRLEQPLESPRSAEVPFRFRPDPEDLQRENRQAGNPSARILRLRAANMFIRAEQQEIIDAECSVCRFEYDDIHYAIKLRGCDHMFCIECIERWLDTNDRCPNRCHNEVLEVITRRLEDEATAAAEAAIRREVRRREEEAQQARRAREERPAQQAQREQRRERLRVPQQERPLGQLLDEFVRDGERVQREIDEVLQRSQRMVASPVDISVSMRDATPSIRSPTAWRSPSRARSPERDNVRPLNRENADWLNAFQNCRPVARNTRPPRGYVVSEDRTRPGFYIYKKVEKCFAFMNGHHLLLSSPSRNDRYPNLLIYDLEAQSLHPGAMRELHVSRPGEAQELDNVRLDEWIWLGSATVKQDTRTFEYQDPSGERSLRFRNPRQRHPFTRVGLARVGSAIWFDQRILENVYGEDRIREKARMERAKRGQAEPIMPSAVRREVRPRPLELVQEVYSRDRTASDSRARTPWLDADRDRRAWEDGSLRNRRDAPRDRLRELRLRREELLYEVDQLEREMFTEDARQRRRNRGQDSEETTL
jgi:hypothetical protein